MHDLGNIVLHVPSGEVHSKVETVYVVLRSIERIAIEPYGAKSGLPHATADRGNFVTIHFASGKSFVCQENDPGVSRLIKVFEKYTL